MPLMKSDTRQSCQSRFIWAHPCLISISAETTDNLTSKYVIILTKASKKPEGFYCPSDLSAGCLGVSIYIYPVSRTLSTYSVPPDTSFSLSRKRPSIKINPRIYRYCRGLRRAFLQTALYLDGLDIGYGRLLSAPHISLCSAVFGAKPHLASEYRYASRLSSKKPTPIKLK